MALPVLRSSNTRLRTLSAYAAALAICLLVLAATFDLRSQTRATPFSYLGDTMFYHLLTKSVVERGWFLDIPLLGAPGTLNLRDVPTSDNNLHLLVLRLLTLGSSHYPTVLNNFFLLGFPLVFLSALWVLRSFGVTWWTSVPASLLYAFAPFHLARGEHHLFLSAYWPVPLAVLVTLWVSGDTFSRDPLRPVWRTRRWWASVGICLILASTGYYYAFFACFFLMLGGVVAMMRQRSWRGLRPASGLVLIIGTGVIVNLSPTLWHFKAQGAVPIVRRVASDADQYGLRIAQLVLPVRGHRVGALEDLKTEYSRRPFVNENDDVSLGLAGAAGFLGLVWWVFFRKPAVDGLDDRGPAGLLHRLSLFNLAGLLFATMGGFGSLAALLGLPQVRAYNRIGVFILFFALFALALWLDALLRRHGTTRRRRWLLGGGLALATILALLDQVSPTMLPNYATAQRLFASDAAFVREIERRVPRGASIFQLPFMTFHESPAVARLKDYGLLRGPLHSRHLRWSYGTIKGRENNAWWRQAAARPAGELVEMLAWAGFSGIYVDRSGFADNGEQITRALVDVLHDSPIRSADQTLEFHALSGYRAWLQEQTPPDEWNARRNAALHPPLIVWRDGFSDEEGTPNSSWRWGASHAGIELVNRANRPQPVRLKMTVRANAGGQVTIDGPLLAKPVRLDRGELDRTFVLPPGKYPLRFTSDAPRASPPNDFRDLVFSVQDLRLMPAESAPASRF